MDHNDADLGFIVDTFRPDLAPYEDFYRDIHQHPDLSKQEARTASIAAKHLREIGYEVQDGIGGHGAVGVFQNGPGKTVLLRAEMDALPVLEETGLPYASQKYQDDEHGVRRPVMHACGHDMHVAALMATAALLKSAKSKWNGTIIALFQPNEERTGGAQAMVDDGLYTKVPRPDVVLGQHIVPRRVGSIAIRAGDLLVHADSIDIRIFGRPGPQLNPQNLKNPTVLACQIVVKLDQIVADEVPKGEYASLSIWDFQAGRKENDLRSYVDINVDLQTYSERVRKQVKAAIRRIVFAECKTAGTLTQPIIKESVRAHVTKNSPQVVAALRHTFEKRFTTEEQERTEDAEDFAVLAAPFKTPYAYWVVGAIDESTWDDAEKKHDISGLIASNHSPFFAPAIQPTLRVATDALALAALTFVAVEDTRKASL
jgi:amidohydrolase